MSIFVDPNDFKVPYAISADLKLFQVGDGRPGCCDIFCPICKTPVSFVQETGRRAAHFRHHSRADCDALARYHRQTLHNAVRDAAFALLNNGAGARSLCRGGELLPTGRATLEETQEAQGGKHRPDITVHPAGGEKAAILELEVVYSHRPEPDRIERAAGDGRLIGVIDIAKIEKDYYRKLYAGEAFDIPEACKAYVLDQRFTILDSADVRRAVRGIVNRKYLEARVLPEHRATKDARVAHPAAARPQPSRLPTRPNTCAVCGVADWHVSMTEKDGSTVHVACSSIATARTATAVDSGVDSGPFSSTGASPKTGGRQVDSTLLNF